jgi:hypothetical protein
MMLPTPNAGASQSPEQKRLLKLFKELAPEQRRSLLDFAEFLHGRAEPAVAELAKPEPIERPEKESVVAAIKRLTRTYPMIDRSRMLHETSELMSQHVIQGRAAAEVIDDLEAAFKRQYQAMIDAVNRSGEGG